MISQFFTNPVSFLYSIIALVIAVTIHELAHAWVADRLGDPNPRLQGRLTLNPLAHLDPLGSLMLLITGFGWGKPVPVDAFNFDNPRRDMALSALAGPASNFILATALSLILRLINTPLASLSAGLAMIIIFLVYKIIALNIALGVFNLLPVPPLDGSKILFGFLPTRQAAEWEDLLNQYGPFLLILLIIPFNGPSTASRLISPIINFMINLLI